MATIQELVVVVDAVAEAIPQIKNAVDALEAKVTEALAQLPTIPPEVQAGIDAAKAKLEDALKGLSEAVADAGDGVDEAAVPKP